MYSYTHLHTPLHTQFLNSTALPVPYVLSKEAAQGLINIIIRASSYTVTQELAADIILEVCLMVLLCI